MEQGWVSLTPLTLDLTDEKQLQEARALRPLDGAKAAVVSPSMSSPEKAQSVQEDEADAGIAKSVAAADGAADPD
jgi:hypothetical protein